MTIEIDVEDVSSTSGNPGAMQFQGWLTPVLRKGGNASVAIRIVDEAEMQALNAQYRGKDKPTNVLSFPADLPAALAGQIDPEPLGDIVLCAPVVRAEAEAQEKPLEDHWAHLSIHGLLHLLGHDHQDEDEAEAMEALEIGYLAELGIADPYRV